MSTENDRIAAGESSGDAGGQKAGLSRRAMMTGVAWTVPAVMLSTAAPAHAVSVTCPGNALYNSQSRGRILSGALGPLDLDNVAAFLGVHAAAWDPTEPPGTPYPGSPGPATSPTYFDTQLRNIDVSVLNGAITAGVGLALAAGTATGVYKEYAYAERDGHAIGASGLISDSGAISLSGGNAGEPQLATLSLRTILQNVTAPAGPAGAAVTSLLANTADVDLVMGALAGRAEMTACTLNVNRTYLLSYLRMILRSNLISQLATQLLNNGVQNQLNNAVNAALGALGALTGVLGVVTANASLTLGIATGDTPPQPNALSINLSQGTATLDIGTLVGGLNGRPANTRLFVDAPILDSIGAATLVSQWATNSLGSAITIGGSIGLRVLGLDVATITITPGTTVTQLISGQGITVTGASAGLVQPIIGVVAATIGNTVINTLLSINSIATLLNSLQVNLIAPLFTVLQSVILIALNLQNASPSPGWTLPADFANLPTGGGTVSGQYDVAALHVGVVNGIILSPAYPVVNLHVGRGSVGQTYLR